MKNQKGVINLALPIVIAVVLLGIIAFGYFWYLPKVNENNNANTNQVAVNTNVSQNQNANSNQNTNATVVVNGNANTNSNTNTAVDTTGWKTYANTTYSYVVKYPTSWELGDSNPANVFFKNGTYGSAYEGGDTGIRIKFYNSPDDMATLKGPVDGTHYSSLAQWIQANKNYVPELAVVSSSFLGLTGHEAAWPAMAGEYRFFLERNSKIMVISLIYLNSPARNINSIGRPEFTAEEQAFFDSFQFTDETAGWKTYTNEDYYFTIKYPEKSNLESDGGWDIIITPGIDNCSFRFDGRGLGRGLESYIGLEDEGVEIDGKNYEKKRFAFPSRRIGVEVILLENNISHIELDYPDNEENSECSGLLSDMLSTFQFAD
ncbi:MAG: hypothetical protein WC528_03765 [Patescibacteria group bacterium]